MQQLDLDQKLTAPHFNGKSKESAADIIASAAPGRAADLLAQPEVKAAINEAYNKVPAWLKLALLVASAIGIGPLLGAYLNAQAVWNLPDKYAADFADVRKVQGEQGEQLNRIEEAIKSLQKVDD